MKPRIGVVVFPGSNDDRDAVLALESLGADPVLVWHEQRVYLVAGPGEADDAEPHVPAPSRVRSAGGQGSEDCASPASTTSIS